MLFTSLRFIVFFSILFVVYYAIPSRFRYILLLVASYGFYATFGIRYVWILLTCTGITYIGGRLLEKHKHKGILFACIVLQAGILCCYKYVPSLILPVGISFYTFQSLGYLIDVYRRNTQAEHNVLKYGLFVSFFPTIVSGPIERSNNLLRQINQVSEFDYDRVKSGILCFLLGFAEKLLIANKLVVMVNYTYKNYEHMTGAAVLFGVLLYGIQIYADFAGYSLMAIGTAKALGIEIPDNFKQPYFAVSIKDFWRRWHISLSTWLRDYIYISLGGSRCSTPKKYRNLLVTFFVSGVWHGADISFVVWGLLHGLYQVIGDLMKPIRDSLEKRMKSADENRVYKVIRIIITFLLVDFAWIFFRADTISQALAVMKAIGCNGLRIAETVQETQYLLGSTKVVFLLLILELIVFFFIDLYHEKKGKLTDLISKQPAFVRYIFYFTVVMILILGVVRDFGGSAAGFIYSKF